MDYHQAFLQAQRKIMQEGRRISEDYLAFHTKVTKAVTDKHQSKSKLTKADKASETDMTMLHVYWHDMHGKTGYTELSSDFRRCCQAQITTRFTQSHR